MIAAMKAGVNRGPWKTSRMDSVIDPQNYDRWLGRTWPTLEYIDTTLKKRRTAVDVGAAEGLITEWLADKFDAVHAFEPVSQHFELLNRTDWGGKVICHNLAVGNRTGMQAIEGVGHAAHITDRTDCPSVPVTTLDALDLRNVDLIKIDVEGFETRVLQGAVTLIANFKPMIMFERKHLFRTRYNDESPTTFLQRHGYRKVFMGPLDTVMVYQPRKGIWE